MKRTCEPLYEGDTNNGRGFCGEEYDDFSHSTICPHEVLPPPSPSAAKLLAEMGVEVGASA